MKLLIITLFLIGGFSGCHEKEEKKESPYLADLKDCFNASTVKIIDSCEYVMTPFIGSGSVGFTMVHHGGCHNKAHIK